MNLTYFASIIIIYVLINVNNYNISGYFHNKYIVIIFLMILIPQINIQFCVCIFLLNILYYISFWSDMDNYRTKIQQKIQQCFNQV